MSKRLRVLVAVVVLGVVGLGWLVLMLNTATITIESSAEAEIFVRQGEEEFTQIGTERAVFKTRASDMVFVEARVGDNATQKSVTPIKRENIFVSLPVEPLSDARLVARGPIIYPHIEGGFIFGINPNTNGLVVHPLEGNEQQPPIPPTLPFLKQIVWFSSGDFVFVSFGRGTGVVRGGELVTREEAFPYVDAAASSDLRHVALLSPLRVFLSNGIDINDAREIASAPLDSSSYVFIDDNFVYLASLVYEGDEDPDHAHVDSEPKETRLMILNKDGQALHEHSLPFKEAIYRVVSIDEETLVILNPEGFSLLDIESGQTRNEEFSFGQVEDMLFFEGRLLLLGGAGLWEYDPGSSLYHKLARYPQGEEYVPNSLTVLNNYLYFSTTISDDELRREETSARSGVYRIDL